MFQSPSYQKLIKIAKPLLILVLTVFVFFKLFYSYHINTLFQRFELQSHLGSFLYLAAALLFVFANWGLEAVKWRMLINRFEPITYTTAMKAVFSGVTLSIITPNQIGDFAGRVIHLELMNKWRGSLVTVIGHTAQVIVTLVFGLFALAFFSNDFSLIGSYAHLYKLLFPFAFIFIVLLVWAYLNLRWIYQKVSVWKWLQKVEKYIDVFAAYSKIELLKILILSFIRYAVFLSQYYFLLKFFQVQIDFLPAVACIIATFCVQSVVPSFLLLEIGLRGVSALFFFSMFVNQTEAVLLSAYSLWIINMLLPGIVGMYFIYKIRS